MPKSETRLRVDGIVERVMKELNVKVKEVDKWFRREKTGGKRARQWSDG